MLGSKRSIVNSSALVDHAGINHRSVSTVTINHRSVSTVTTSSSVADREHQISIALEKIDELIAVFEDKKADHTQIDALIQVTETQKRLIVEYQKEYRTSLIQLQQSERRRASAIHILYWALIYSLIAIFIIGNSNTRKSATGMPGILNWEFVPWAWNFLLHPFFWGVWPLVFVGVIILYLLVILIVKIKGVPFRLTVNRSRKSAQKLAEELSEITQKFKTDSFRCVHDYQLCRAAAFYPGTDLFCIIGFITCQIMLILSKIHVKVSA
jgi:hypothetical protein